MGRCTSNKIDGIDGKFTSQEIKTGFSHYTEENSGQSAKRKISQLQADEVKRVFITNGKNQKNIIR